MLVARLVMYCLCLVYVWSCLVMFGWGLVTFGQGAEFDFAEPFDFLREIGFGSFMQRSTYNVLGHPEKLTNIPYNMSFIDTFGAPFAQRQPKVSEIIGFMSTG